MPISMPSSVAARSAQCLASAASTLITPSSRSVWRLRGMNPAPRPWIGCGPGDRKSVVEGTRVSVRVDLGGRRIIKNITHQYYELSLEVPLATGYLAGHLYRKI